MNILIVNDDGIEARGLAELADALRNRAGASVYVCAPDGQRSASGHGITVRKPITVEERHVENAEKAFAFSGLPADCVKLGLVLLERKGVGIDMVFSGINHGGNLGTDTLYSGTVSGAIEGSICGKPSVAVSVNSHKAAHFGYACDLAVDTVDKAGGRLNPETVLNINVPNLPRSEIKGFRHTVLGRREYDEQFDPVETEDGREAYVYTGQPVIYSGLPGNVDVVAMQDGYASITPLNRDLTDRSMIEEVKKWRIGQ